MVWRIDDPQVDKKMSPQLKYYWKNREQELAQNKEWMEKNKEKRREYQRKRYLLKREENIDRAKRSNVKKKYGISYEQYISLVSSQEECSICGGKNEGRPLFVDHEHKSGKIRGLLCSHCNLVIGFCKEKVSILQRTILYLEAHNGVENN